MDQIINVTGGASSISNGEGITTNNSKAESCLYGEYTADGVKACAPAPICQFGETYSVANGCGYNTCKLGIRGVGYYVGTTCTSFVPSTPPSCRLKTGEYFSSSQNACGVMWCSSGFVLRNNLCIYQPII